MDECDKLIEIVEKSLPISNPDEKRKILGDLEDSFREIVSNFDEAMASNNPEEAYFNFNIMAEFARVMTNKYLEVM